MNLERIMADELKRLTEGELKKVTVKKLKKLLSLHERWLECEPGGVRLDLHDNPVSFRGLSLTGANLKMANLSNCDLAETDLSGAELQHAQLVNTNLYGANLDGAWFSEANLTGANLSFIIVSNAVFSDANLTNANLESFHGEHIKMNRAILDGAHIESPSRFKASDFTQASFKNANCNGARFVYTNLDGADFSNVNLRLAKFYGSSLRGANLTGARLKLTSFESANITEAQFDEQEQIRLGKILKEDMIGYTVGKKTSDKDSQEVIVKLLIPAGAIVFSINNYRCRTNKAKALEIEDGESTGCSDESFTYTVGQELEVKDFNLQYNLDSGSGIHFYKTREETNPNYILYMLKD